MKLIFGVRPETYEREGQPVTTVQVAIWNEYGTQTIPPRPAFRRGAEHAIQTNRRLLQSQLQNIVRRKLMGREAEADQSLRVVLTQIGRSAVAETKRIIKAGDELPNAPKTVAKKGFNHPLYETGRLLDCVEYEVQA